MKKKIILTLVSLLSVLLLAGCGGNGGADPTPGPGPESEITSNNAAPSGFVDDGPMDWDE